MLRRAGAAAPAPEPLRFGDVEVDFRRHQAQRCAAQPLELSPREFRLLAFFAATAARW